LLSSSPNHDGDRATRRGDGGEASVPSLYGERIRQSPERLGRGDPAADAVHLTADGDLSEIIIRGSGNMT